MTSNVVLLMVGDGEDVATTATAGGDVDEKGP